MKKSAQHPLALVSLRPSPQRARSGSARRRRESGLRQAQDRPPRRTGKRQTCWALAAPVRGGDDGALDKESDGNAGALGRGNNDLNIEITPLGQLLRKIPDGFFSGEGPDVGYMYLEMFNDFIEMGALEPLDASYITDADRENYLYLDKGFIKGQAIHDAVHRGQRAHPVFQYGHSGAGGRDGTSATRQELADVAVKIKRRACPA